LHGYISDSEKVNLLKKSDVFIFPTFCEAFGIVVLEAMENGLNIIASDLPVFKEIFGSSIEYFEKGNCIDLAKKMQLKNIGDQSKYKNILEKYSYENFYIKCKQVFNVINNEGEK